MAWRGVPAPQGREWQHVEHGCTRCRPGAAASSQLPSHGTGASTVRRQDWQRGSQQAARHAVQQAPAAQRTCRGRQAAGRAARTAPAHTGLQATAQTAHAQNPACPLGREQHSTPPSTHKPQLTDTSRLCQLTSCSPTITTARTRWPIVTRRSALKVAVVRQRAVKAVEALAVVVPAAVRPILWRACTQNRGTARGSHAGRPGQQQGMLPSGTCSLRLRQGRWCSWCTLGVLVQPGRAAADESRRAQCNTRR